jgi:hypothetical protein
MNYIAFVREAVAGRPVAYQPSMAAKTLFIDIYDHLPPRLPKIRDQKSLSLVLATGPGNPPAVRVWSAKMSRFGSRPGQTPDPLTLGGPNPDPYPSISGFRRVWLDSSGPFSGSAFRVSHLWSHSDMLLLIVKY